jgi:hypothetical protein
MGFDTTSPLDHAGGWSVLDHMWLMELEVANCGLSGPLPSTLYYANNNVNGNGTSGSPLKRLQLQGNSLTGTLPQTWSSLRRLACLQLHNNPGLCGDVPSGLPCFTTTGTSLGKALLLSPTVYVVVLCQAANCICRPEVE